MTIFNPCRAGALPKFIKLIYSTLSANLRLLRSLSPSLLLNNTMHSKTKLPFGQLRVKHFSVAISPQVEAFPLSTRCKRETNALLCFLCDSLLLSLLFSLFLTLFFVSVCKLQRINLCDKHPTHTHGDRERDRHSKIQWK